MRKASLLNAAIQIRVGTVVNDLVADGTLTLAKLAKGSDILLRDGSVAMTGDLDMGGRKVFNAAAATEDNGLVTKAQLEAFVLGFDPKESVRVATTANIDLASGGLLTIDGQVLVAGDRVLVKDQTDATENGIYVAYEGAWARSADADTGTLTKGAYVFVEVGTQYKGTGWVLTVDGDLELGVSALSFIQFSETGDVTAGAGLTKAGKVMSVDVGNGIAIVGNKITVDAEDGTIVVSADGVKVGTITDTNIADGTISVSKLNLAGSSILMADGSVAWTANQDAGGQKLVNLQAGAADGDATNLKQVTDAIAAAAQTTTDAIPQFVYADEMTGDRDGVNTTFVLGQVPVPVASLQVRLNGQVKTPGADFTLVGDTITTTGFVVTADDDFVADYRVN